VQGAGVERRFNQRIKELSAPNSNFLRIESRNYGETCSAAEGAKLS
jgi:hypothetical protein